MGVSWGFYEKFFCDDTGAEHFRNLIYRLIKNGSSDIVLFMIEDTLVKLNSKVPNKIQFLFFEQIFQLYQYHEEMNMNVLDVSTDSIMKIWGFVFELLNYKVNINAHLRRCTIKLNTKKKKRKCEHMYRERN